MNRMAQRVMKDMRQTNVVQEIEVSNIEQRINRTEDRTAIIEALYDYCRNADLLNPDGMMAHFTEDCQVTYLVGAAPISGKATVLGMLREFLPTTASSQHMITNHQVVFASDHEAVLHACLLSWQRFKAYPQRSDTNRFGRYEARLVRTHDGWRFTHLVLIVAGESGETRYAEHFGRPFPARFN
jgi:hypothetical protein